MARLAVKTGFFRNPMENMLDAYRSERFLICFNFILDTYFYHLVRAFHFYNEQIGSFLYFADEKSMILCTC